MPTSAHSGTQRSVPRLPRHEGRDDRERQAHGQPRQRAAHHQAAADGARPVLEEGVETFALAHRLPHPTLAKAKRFPKAPGVRSEADVGARRWTARKWITGPPDQRTAGGDAVFQAPLPTARAGAKPLIPLSKGEISPERPRWLVSCRAPCRAIPVTNAEEAVLPSSKRPARSKEPSEVIRTGDYEVVHGSSSSKGRVAAQRTSDRPRVFQQPVDDEDKTLLFAGSIRAMLPPRPQTPVATPPIAKPARTPNMNLRGLTREPARASERPPSPESLRGSVRPRMDTEDRTILRPTSTLPPSMQAREARATPPAIPAPAPAARPPSARPPAMMPTPYMPMKPVAAGQTAPPVSLNAPGGTDARKPAASDPHGDPPSAVITAKTRILRTRSSMSWAVGLMALGAVVGLITAVVARGDADAIIDATASFVDPSHSTAAAHANGAVAQAAVLPSFVETSRKTAPLGTDSNPAPGACLDPGAAGTTVTTPVVVNSPPPAAHTPEVKTAALAGADPSQASRPAPPKPAPLAFAAPAHAPSRAAPPPAAAPKENAPSSGWLANVTPPNAGGPIARPSKSGGKPAGNDFESAAAADALAKAQLEASLR